MLDVQSIDLYSFFYLHKSGREMIKTDRERTVRVWVKKSKKSKIAKAESEIRTVPWITFAIFNLFHIFLDQNEALYEFYQK